MKIFLAIGNYSDYKNFIMLVKVFRELEKQDKDMILLIIGRCQTEASGNYNKLFYNAYE